MRRSWQNCTAKSFVSVGINAQGCIFYWDEAGAGAGATSKSSKSAVVSLTHFNPPQQQLKFLQLLLRALLTIKPPNPRREAESVSQKAELNSSYHVIFLLLMLS